MKIDKVTKGGVIMAAIEFGIDGYGCKIAASNAISGRTYKCYYCKEDICVRKGKKEGRAERKAEYIRSDTGDA